MNSIRYRMRYCVLPVCCVRLRLLAAVVLIYDVRGEEMRGRNSYQVHRNQGIHSNLTLVIDEATEL